MYGSNSNISLRYNTKEYLDSILDGWISHDGQYGLYFDLGDLGQRMIGNGWYQKYHRTFDELFKEYLLNPTDRMFYKDKTSGKWEYSSKDIEGIVTFIRYELRKDYNAIELLTDDKNTMELLEIFADHPDGSSTEYVFLICVSRIWEPAGMTWEELYPIVKNEITNCNRDYNKHRLTLLCILMGIVMIRRNDVMAVDCVELFVKHWHFLAHFYSVMTGKIVGSELLHINSVIGNFIGTRARYAWAMKIAVEHSINRLKRDMNNKGRMKLDELLSRLGTKANEVEQDTSISELFSILFPKAEWDSYNNAAPRRTAAETQHLIEEKERMLDEWKNKVEQLEHEIEELRPLKELVDNMRGALRGKMISVEALKNAILSYPPKVARELFGQLDWYLDGHDDTWDDIRHELKDKITEMEIKAVDAKVINTHAYYAPGAQHRDITMTGNDATYNENNNNNNIKENNGEKNTDDRR